MSLPCFGGFSVYQFCSCFCFCSRYLGIHVLTVSVRWSDFLDEANESLHFLLHNTFCISSSAPRSHLFSSNYFDHHMITKQRSKERTNESHHLGVVEAYRSIAQIFVALDIERTMTSFATRKISYLPTTVDNNIDNTDTYMYITLRPYVQSYSSHIAC